ncbi:unnamed protein product [Euphydryas editha]|uniref:Uncharacterized protein n=1 Tax=Euphydryas editha TaxID=104508 RepID=A0AAU9TY51_EUPED|nr:unnamed protein product [Euphydryas editha]
MSRFEGRNQVAEEERTIIITNIPSLMQLTLLLNLHGTFKHIDFISSAYWLLDISNDPEVIYEELPADHEGAVVRLTTLGQQCAAFSALSTMIGFVKDITAQNVEVGLKRWKAGLESQFLPELLDELVKKAIWNCLAAHKLMVYSDVRRRELILRAYLAMKDDLTEQMPLVKAVFTQLNLEYNFAHLKSVQYMHDFILSGNRALILPNLRREAKAFKEVIDEVRLSEGPNFPLCRLIDKNKHPNLNHSLYPDLYAVSILWAKETKKVEKSYRVTKAIVDRSIDFKMAQELIKTRDTKRFPPISAEDRIWLRSIGCEIDEEEVIKTLKKTDKRRLGVIDTERSESESGESDTGTDVSRKRRRTRE